MTTPTDCASSAPYPPQSNRVPPEIWADDQGVRGVLPHHRDHLRASGLTDDTIRASGIYSETDCEKIARLLGWKKYIKKCLPAIVIPYLGVDGYFRVRPDNPRRNKNGKPVKYDAPRQRPNELYVPPGAEDCLDDPKRDLLITEGEKKALAATQEGFPCLGLSGVHAWSIKGHEQLLPALARIRWRGRQVWIVFDSDLTEKPHVADAESRLAKLLENEGAVVRCVRLPDGPPDAAGAPTKIGLDDFLVSQGDNRKFALRALLDAAIDPEPIETPIGKSLAKLIDPAPEAEALLKTTEYDGRRTLVFWQGSYWKWSIGRYGELSKAEVQSEVIRGLNAGYSHLSTSITADVMAQIQAQSVVPFRIRPPSWFDDELQEQRERWKPRDVIAFRNSLIDLPALVRGDDQNMRPATPAYFTLSALDYDFDPSAPEPKHWLAFLNQLWPDDPDSISTLQEWFGYCLTPDTSQQKILLIVGPKRCGKGTINRVMQAVVGSDNVASPTLASLATNFGLAPLVGKSLAVIADARLSGKSDQAIVVERLLSISGEDPLTIDRKHREQITLMLQARLMILTNELPRLNDSSGALAGRMIPLRITQSFYNQEDTGLSRRLIAERAGILLWAIAGWARLRDRGRFDPPTSGNELTRTMNELSSPVGAFVADCCDVGPGRCVRVGDLYAAWCNWCKENGREPSTRQVFGRDLAAVANVTSTQPRNEGHSRYRVYEGICLRP